MGFSLGEFRLDDFRLDVQLQVRKECLETGLSTVGKIASRDGGYYDVTLPDGKTLRHVGVNCREAFSIGDHVNLDQASGLWVITGRAAESFS